MKPIVTVVALLAIIVALVAGSIVILNSPPVTKDPGTVAGTECQDPRPQACTREYRPVCGWFNQNIQCVTYPCAATYGNSCTACADENVAYWTPGECPAPGSAP